MGCARCGCGNEARSCEEDGTGTPRHEGQFYYPRPTSSIDLLGSDTELPAGSVSHTQTYGTLVLSNTPLANQTDVFILIDEQLKADFIAEGKGASAAAAAATAITGLLLWCRLPASCNDLTGAA